MRAYVATSGIMFGLLVIAPVARLAVEGPRAFHSPIFLLASVLSIGMLVWSVLVFLRLGDSGGASSIDSV